MALIARNECVESRNLGQEIVSFMREYCDRKSEETGLNFTLLATPAEGLSGRFVRVKEKLQILIGFDSDTGQIDGGEAQVAAAVGDFLLALSAWQKRWWHSPANITANVWNRF